MPMELLTDATSEHLAPKTNNNTFQHISNGRSTDTQLAIELYLRSLKLPRPKYTAELIVFMEVSFKGKYKEGDPSHYQRIMPSENWRSGDTLSEKLTRCKDKETFKKRFDLIGSTETMRAEHFEKWQINDENLNFKGKLYLRLMDTVRGNLSHFFRDDLAVDTFIKAALQHHEEQRTARRKKTGGVSAIKAEVVHLKKTEVVTPEKPKSLQYTKIDTEKNTEKTGNSLALVHPFPYGKNQQQTPEGKYEQVQKLTSTSPKQAAGSNSFLLWRKAVLEKHPDKCISSIATKAQIGIASELSQRFSEFFPANQMSDFLREVSQSWISLSKRLKEDGVWQNLGSYPDFSSLLKHSNHIFTWYRKRLSKPTEELQKATQAQEPSKKLPDHPPVPFIGCNTSSAPGRTFRVNDSESLEYIVAMAPTCNFPKHAVLSLMEQIKTLSVDFAASEKRIAELETMSDEEREQYCC